MYPKPPLHAIGAHEIIQDLIQIFIQALLATVEKVAPPIDQQILEQQISTATPASTSVRPLGTLAFDGPEAVMTLHSLADAPLRLRLLWSLTSGLNKTPSIAKTGAASQARPPYPPPYVPLPPLTTTYHPYLPHLPRRYIRAGTPGRRRTACGALCHGCRRCNFST